MRCSRCVLPDCTPNISFDSQGVCNYCHTYQPTKYLGEEALLEALEPFRGSGEKYDCIVGISGGRDSAYVILKLVKDYGMRVLAVNYENPFTVPQAKENIRNIVEALDVDVVSFKDRNGRHVKALRGALNAWLRKPSPAVIPIMCVGCKPVWLDIYRTAKKHNIKCVITGGNPYEVISFKRELVKIDRDAERENAFFKYAYAMREIFKNPAFYNPHLVLAMMRAYLFGAPFAVGLKAYGANMLWIQFFDYLLWEEKELISRIEKELNWSKPAELKSSWRFDCRVKHLADFAYMKTDKMTDKDDFYAKIVREGGMTRDEALKKLENEGEIYFDEIRTLLDQAGVKDQSFLDRM